MAACAATVPPPVNVADATRARARAFLRVKVSLGIPLREIEPSSLMAKVKR